MKRKDREIWKAVRMARLPVEFSSRDAAKITRFSAVQASCIMRDSRLFTRRRDDQYKSGRRYFYSLAVDQI